MDVKSSSRWFHPDISGKDAENLLMKNGYSGCFLVRESRSKVGNFTLSVRRNNEVIHVKIYNNGDYYDLATGSEFASLYELVSYYTDEGNPLKETNGKPLEPKFPLYAPEFSNNTEDPWFHGNLDGSKAEQLLVQNGKPQSFLVRERAKTPGEFVLCILLNEKNVTQVLIAFEQGQFHIKAETVETQFVSLADLVNHYKTSPITLGSGAQVKLKEPVLVARAGSGGKRIESSKSTDKYQEEFDQLQKQDGQNQKPRKEGSRPENKEKNRYKNILPFDHSRVKLRDGDPLSPCSEYINANYIKVDNIPVSYIATQGCLAATVPDFWRMVWQENTRIITMITKRVEQGKNKCILYWPEKVDHPLVYNLYKSRITVEFVKLKPGPKNEYAVREFKLTYEKEEGDKFTEVGKRTVFQYNFTAWPDKSVPQQPDSLLSFILKIHEHQRKLEGAGPLVVHCSAGIGRTGTFIVIGLLVTGLETYGKEFDDSIKSMVLEIRKARSGMVQVDQQYRLIYDVMDYYKKNYMPTDVQANYVNVQLNSKQDQNDASVYEN